MKRLYLALAGQLEFIVTGGSDFHGDHKPAISLGTGKSGNVQLSYAVLRDMRELRPAANSPNSRRNRNESLRKSRSGTAAPR